MQEVQFMAAQCLACRRKRRRQALGRNEPHWARLVPAYEPLKDSKALISFSACSVSLTSSK
jgi:hypothetical protein